MSYIVHERAFSRHGGEAFDPGRDHAADGEPDGSALIALRDGAFDLVVTDRAMPGMSGDQLALAIKDLLPRLPVVLLTGFGELMLASGDRPLGVDAVAAKPVTLARLRELLAGVMGTPDVHA